MIFSKKTCIFGKSETSEILSFIFWESSRTKNFEVLGFLVFLCFLVLGVEGDFPPRNDAIRRAFITVRLGHVLKVRNDIAILLL
jgi:hypothetical protein